MKEQSRTWRTSVQDFRDCFSLHSRMTRDCNPLYTRMNPFHGSTMPDRFGRNEPSSGLQGRRDHPRVSTSGSSTSVLKLCTGRVDWGGSALTMGPINLGYVALTLSCITGTKNAPCGRMCTRLTSYRPLLR